MDVEFMVSDTLEVRIAPQRVRAGSRALISNLSLQMLRPKMTPFKTFQEAAVAIDDMIVAQPLEGKADGISPSIDVNDSSAHARRS
jgi:hypothetical protein